VNLYEAAIGDQPIPFGNIADAVVNSGASVAYIP